MALLPTLMLTTGGHAPQETGVPSSWLRKWSAPPAEDRPLQIIHGIPISGGAPSGMAQMVPGADPEEAALSNMSAYRDLGLGGVVCNVLFDEYLQSPAAWQALHRAVHACRQLGMVVWIYDEKGYPSGSAGGLVLRNNPEYEAQELAYDASRPDPFILRPSYEFTHAANNYHAARRYPNLLDERAVRKFLALTHQAYRRHLGSDLGTVVRAFFTDEPSLLAVNLGQIPEAARRNVPVEDAPDPTARPLPAVPWVYDLADRYQQRYGEDLIAVRRSLFEGDSDADKTVRRRFWQLVGDLLSERYFGTIQQWCRENRVASSGHNLWEEALMHHPALYGNALKALTRMDIPGMDELSSDPAVVLHGHWMTAAMPASAAILSGGRRVFTEVSDFSEKMSGRGPASLPMMLGTAAWQAAMGVTEFTLYYSIRDRSAEDYRTYCEYVGRLNAVLKPARLAPRVLLYYPIYDLMAEYKPVAEPLSLNSQSPRAQRIVGSFQRLGTALTRSQIPFCLADYEALERMAVRNGRLALGRRPFSAVVLPSGVELPARAQAVIQRFAAAGGTVVSDDNGRPLDSPALVAALKPEHRLTPPSGEIVLGRFERDGYVILALVNVGNTRWVGNVTVPGHTRCIVMNPHDGSVVAAHVAGSGVAISLDARQARLLALK